MLAWLIFFPCLLILYVDFILFFLMCDLHSVFLPVYFSSWTKWSPYFSFPGPQSSPLFSAYIGIFMILNAPGVSGWPHFPECVYLHFWFSGRRDNNMNHSDPKRNLSVTWSWALQFMKNGLFTDFIYYEKRTFGIQREWKIHQGIFSWIPMFDFSVLYIC